jgi:thioredoxin-like negative regulator of GroEL
MRGLPDLRSQELDDDYALEDRYRSYALEDAVYADFDWDSVEVSLVHRHDAILEMERADLEALDLAHPSDEVLRWAAARRWLELGEEARFAALLRDLLQTPPERRSALLSYPDLRLEQARFVGVKEPQAGLDALEAYRLDPRADGAEHARLRCLLLALRGPVGEAEAALREALDAHAPKEPRLGLDVAEELMDLGRAEEAQAFLAVAGQKAKALGHSELVLEAQDLAALCQREDAEPKQG